MGSISRTASLLLATALAACASAPVKLVALPAAPPAAADRKNVPSSRPTLLLRPVRIPGYLDHFPVVIGRRSNILIMAQHAEWAERLSDAVPRVLRDALSERLGASHVLIAGDGRIPDADLSIEFFALDPRNGALRLDARWTFFCTARDRAHSGDTDFEVPLHSATASAVAAATSHALARLADALAKEAICTQNVSDSVRQR